MYIYIYRWHCFCFFWPGLWNILKILQMPRRRSLETQEFTVRFLLPSHGSEGSNFPEIALPGCCGQCGRRHFGGTKKKHPQRTSRDVLARIGRPWRKWASFGRALCIRARSAHKKSKKSTDSRNIHGDDFINLFLRKRKWNLEKWKTSEVRGTTPTGVSWSWLW